MPQSGNVGFSMTPLPTPEAQPVQVSTYADEAKQNQAQMPPVYWGGKTGSAAFMADKVLTGWLAGTKIAHERKAKQMADEVGAAKTGLDYIGQAYKAAVESGDQKKIAETQGALKEAYNDYLNKAEKYALPDQQMDPKTGKPKKQGVGSKVKQGLMGGENPHLQIAHSTLDIMRKTDPTQLYGPSKQESQQSELVDAQLKQVKQQQQEHDRWTKIATQDPSKPLSAEDKKFQEYYEYEHFGKTEADQIKDDLLTKVASGAQMTAQERQLAENMGIIKPQVTNTVTRTVMGPKGQPQTQLVSIGPDGKVVGTQMLPGNEYVPPNQAQMAGQLINAQMGAMMKWGAKMHPEWDQNTDQGKKALTSWAMTTLYPPTAGAINWGDEQQKMDVMNRALGAVIQRHTSKRKDPNDPTKETQVYDELGNSVIGNIVSTTDDGRYAYMPSLKPGTPGDTHWFRPNDPETWSGMTREQLNDQERKFQAELRAELKKQNPKMPDSYLDQLVPSMLTGQKGGAQAMSAPPQQGGAKAMSAPPQEVQGGGERDYQITLPDGTKATRKMSPEYADVLKARGVTVIPIGF